MPKSLVRSADGRRNITKEKGIYVDVDERRYLKRKW